MSLFGIRNIIKPKKAKNAEFGLYESIVHGELRPFLPKYSSTEYFENFTNPPKKEFEDEDFSDDFDNLLDEAEKEGSENAENDQIDYSHDLELQDSEEAGFDLDEDFLGADDELCPENAENDQIEEGHALEIDEEIKFNFESDLEPEVSDDQNGLIDQEECLDLESGKHLEFDKLNIPRPPDKKAEYFLSLIENEFDEIKKRAQKFLHDEQKEKQISQFAKENIQKAKKIAVDSGHLNKLLKPEDSDPSSDSDAYIIHVLGLFLIRSISFYQGLFEPFLKDPRDSEDELRACVENPYVFSQKGECWKINFNGQETIIRDLERIRYIVHLLDNPKKEFFCYELINLVKGENSEISDLQTIYMIDPVESDAEREHNNQKINLVNPFESDLPAEDLQAINNVAHKLWEKLDDPNLSSNEKTRAQEDWKTAVSHYASAYGILLRSTKKGPLLKPNKQLKIEFERQRSLVTNQISKARKSIGKIIPPL